MQMTEKSAPIYWLTVLHTQLSGNVLRKGVTTIKQSLLFCLVVHVDGARPSLWTAATNDLLFIPHVKQWNDVGTGKLLILHQSSRAILAVEPSRSKEEERAKEIINFALRSIFVHTYQVVFLHTVNLMTWGLRSYFPTQPGPYYPLGSI